MFRRMCHISRWYGIAVTLGVLAAPAVLGVLAPHAAFATDITGAIVAKGAKTNADAVIYIDHIAGKEFPAPKEHPVMNQKNIAFQPRVLPVLVGTTVDFLNSDDVLHNVFCPDKCANKFNLGTWPKGQKKSFTYTTACASMVLCNVHPEMQAYVVVVETPYFAVSAKDGSYTIKDVPPGTYTLKVWHEKLKGAPVSVVVPATGSVKQDFALAK